MANFNWTFVNVDGVVNVSAISASSYISASTIYATTITASNFVTVNKLSIDVSGSTSFGDSNDDTHIRTGSLSVYRTANAATLPAELLKLEIGDEGADMNIGSGPGIDFFVGETGGSDYAGTIAVVREQAADANTDSAMVFHTTTDDQVKANDREKMRITSAGKVGIGTTNPAKTLTVVGEVSASATITGSAFETATTVINSTHISSSLTISGAAFFGNGAQLTGMSPITSYNTVGDNRVITSVNSNTIAGEANLTFDGSKLSAVGQISASLGVTGSSLETATTVINSTHISSSLNISGANFYGNGTQLTGMSPITSYNTVGDNRILTSVDASTIAGEANLTFDGSKLSAVGQISASLGITGSSVHTLNTIIDATHVSSSLNLSASAFYGDGSTLSGIINSYANPGNNRIITSVDSDSVNSEANLTFDGSKLSAVGQISASLGVTGSSIETATTVINNTHISSSLNISGANFYGNGAQLSGVSPITNYNTVGDNRILTSVDASTIAGEANLTFDGNDLTVASSTASRPRFYIENQNTDENPSQLIFHKTSSSPAENDVIGRIAFQSYDSAGNATIYGQIEGEIKKPNSGGERGRIKFTVAEFDGTLTEALTLQGSNVNGKVDVVVANGSLTVTDDNKLYFGTGIDASIEYNEDGDDLLVISGSATGTVISGSKLILDTTTVASGAIAGPGSYLGVTTAGQIVLTASAAGGGSTSPGGSDTQVQYNNGGSFGGIASLTFNDGTGDLNIIDDKKLFFGTNSDASIEYNENGDNLLIISGAAAGTVISGSRLVLDTITVTSGTIAGPGSYLGVTTAGQIVLTASAAGGGSTSPGGSDTQVQYNNGGSFGGIASLTFNDGTGDLNIIDDKKLFFGTNSDASIEYDENGSDKLIISGAHGGIHVSGSGGLTVAVNDGLTVTSATDDTPVITIENTSDGIGGGALNFKRTTTDEAANDIIGSVNFMAKDAAGNEHIYAAIQGLIDDPTSGGEEGRLIFKVAEFDGNQQEGLRIEGQASNGIVDVRVSNGSLQLKDLGGAGTTPASGFGGLYVNGDNLYFINDGGTSAQLNGSSGGSTAYNSFTVNYTVATSHDIMGIVTTGSAITASLASAATYAAGQKFIFKDVSGSCSGSNHIVISASQNHVGQNIDGQGILKIQAGYGSITLASDGVASFYIIGTN